MVVSLSLLPHRLCIVFLLRRGAVVIDTAQLHSTKFELWFCTSSNPACDLLEDSRWLESLTIVPAGNKAKRLSSVNHTAKTIHHHHSFND